MLTSKLPKKWTKRSFLKGKTIQNAQKLAQKMYSVALTPGDTAVGKQSERERERERERGRRLAVLADRRGAG